MDDRTVDGSGVDDWDVVIVGAGPAGTTAAIAARQADPHARVLILDAATFPRDKVCGDGIAPHAFDIWRDLGVNTELLTADTELITRLRLRSPGGVEAVRSFARPASVVPRLLLDDRLLRHALDVGAVLRKHRVRKVSPARGGVVVDATIKARTVIGADGAESVVRRGLDVRAALTGTVAIAVRGYASADAWPVHEQLLSMTRAHWPAYAWVFPIGDGQANVGYGELLQGTPPSRAHLAQRLQALLPGVEPTALRGHRLPLSTGRPALADGRTLLVGDAASLINPLTGEGIYYAALSGSLAGAAALTDDPASSYRQSMRRALGRHLRHTDVIARLGRWPTLLDAGIGAARDSQRVFDSVVDIGLGSATIDPRTAFAVARRALRP